MKKPRVVSVSEIKVTERAPPAPPSWVIVESYPQAKSEEKGFFDGLLRLFGFSK